MSSLSLVSVILSVLLLLVSHVSSQAPATLTFTQQTSRAPFSPRANGNVESLNRNVNYVVNGQTRTATGPLILQGSDNVPAENDVWLSPDNGINWYLLSGVSRNNGGQPVSAPNGGDSSFRTTASGVAFTTDSNNNIFRIQGQSNPAWPWDAGTCTNETWWSADGGITWLLRGSANPTPARKFASAISDSANNLYILGGHRCSDWQTQYDVWMSANQGATWQQQTANSNVDGPAVGILLNIPVAARATGLNFRDALLYTTGWNGGIDYNTVFLSVNQGRNWVKYPGAAAFSARDDANGEVTKEGLIVIVGGKHEFTVSGNLSTEFYNDVWVSPDGGWTVSAIALTFLTSLITVATRIVSQLFCVLLLLCDMLSTVESVCGGCDVLRSSLLHDSAGPGWLPVRHRRRRWQRDTAERRVPFEYLIQQSR